MLFIKNLIVRIKSSFDRDPGKIPVHPDRIWFFTIMLFFAVVIAISLFSFYFFRSINSDSYFTTNIGSGDSLNTISREKLNKALEYLHNKEANFEYVKNHKPNIIDPSK